MKMAESWHRYILLSERGAIASDRQASELLERLPRARSMAEPVSVPLEAAEGRTVTVVDAAHPTGPRLVDADHEIAGAVNRSRSPLRMVPLIEFAPPNPPLRVQGDSEPAASGGGGGTPPPTVALTVSCTDAAGGAAVAGARVVAFNDFAYGIGAAGTTDASGSVSLKLWSTAVERLYVEPPESGGASYWGAFLHSLNVSASVGVALTPVDLSYVDGVRHYYGNSNFDEERGVEVGIIDTGVGPHRDLNVISGVNTVTHEPANAYVDPRGHGTHVAGLVGSNGTPPTGLRGLAPGVRLRAYRVFPEPSPQGEGGASNYSILKAIYRAMEDGCDVINLSLGGGPHDPVTQEAVVEAREAGILVVIAAGNDYRAPASFPSAYPRATAVSAMGRRGTFPNGSLEHADIAQSPVGNDPAEFLATFSNVGQEVSVAAPGVGDLSTLPGNRFGPMSGTSMAAPVVCGAVACLLSQNGGVYEMGRDGDRSQAIEDLLSASCTALGFGAMYEGKGMPDPNVV